jgi:hypothetical protein
MALKAELLRYIVRGPHHQSGFAAIHGAAYGRNDNRSEVESLVADLTPRCDRPFDFEGRGARLTEKIGVGGCGFPRSPRLATGARRLPGLNPGRHLHCAGMPQQCAGLCARRRGPLGLPPKSVGQQVAGQLAGVSDCFEYLNSIQSRLLQLVGSIPTRPTIQASIATKLRMADGAPILRS